MVVGREVGGEVGRVVGGKVGREVGQEFGWEVKRSAEQEIYHHRRSSMKIPPKLHYVKLQHFATPVDHSYQGFQRLAYYFCKQFNY